MTDEAMTLQQIAQLAVDRNGGAGGRALDRVAKSKGLTLSYTTVDKIIAGTYRSTPKASTLDALSVLAGVPAAQVYKAAERPVPRAKLADQLPEGADSLTPQQREVVLGLVRQFVQANEVLTSARNLVVHGVSGTGLEDRLRILLHALHEESSPRVPADVFYTANYDALLEAIFDGANIPDERELKFGTYGMPDEDRHDDTPDDPRFHYDSLADAARTTGKPSAGQQRRKDAEQAGEPPADDPDDVEPR
ncbi:hypothetical protein [Nocardioides sp. 503]|uniref:hypothetical protein n=1 Tax=Nocardioides sp. 503 TaxID=2508326 RepID=UPI0010704A85|nr:hypothetical protein [Nocardioides sp. 503]